MANAFICITLLATDMFRCTFYLSFIQKVNPGAKYTRTKIQEKKVSFKETLFSKLNDRINWYPNI